MNALSHGADSIYTPFANPVSRMTALRGAELIAGALDDPTERDRAALALGSILCGYAIDSGMFAIHHVVCRDPGPHRGSPHAESGTGRSSARWPSWSPEPPDQLSSLATAIGTTPQRNRSPASS